MNNYGLVFKWLKSENTSSKESKRLGNITRKYLGLSHKQYRKLLSIGREKTKVLERIMSEGKWEDIDFSKIPSKAGIKYKNAFARHDIERAKSGAETYADFAKSDKKVNASVLNPVDIAHKAFGGVSDKTDRLMLQKYWDCQKDYYNGRTENGIAVVDVSGSMSGMPMEAAVSMGAYIAERGHGPFANHFITFSQRPQLVEFAGVDIVDKFQRARRADWGYNTNIQAVFDLLLNTAIKKGCKAYDMPERIYIFSDMEFDEGIGMSESRANTLFENIKEKWANYGYKLPDVVFWNLDARHENIPAIGRGFSYVSGQSMNMIESILSGKDGYALMMDKLDSERYSAIK